ncbi:phospholipase/carboxylesterase [Gemmobacter megaterium]|uniref:Phospholipase/carboxylesterase n=1 Tax=Gemmobacter megaterium TaxID=1086013 RepID=A0A1N7MFZ6_9RHOB|nr:alpha/beta fold hydrolase [Gemmobacter megaterium]GGE07001.1 phospholipase [Gemmobacter megaterium]SIS84950.1 phospholipase/carboxylesterase [Gemmobacter megaterium]
MTRKLNAKRKPSQSGDVKSAVIFLHGYGADGADLLGLADPLAPHLPDTAFHAPDAPERCTGNPFGFQWFPIPWLDGSSDAEAEAGLAAAADDLNAYIDSVLATEGLAPDRLALVGFSQGTMMSLHVALRRDEELAGVVAFSGRLLRPDRLMTEMKVKPPVLLVHGDADPVVPFDDMRKAAEALVEARVETYAHVMKGTGHGIAPDGLGVALNFLRDRLG